MTRQNLFCSSESWHVQHMHNDITIYKESTCSLTLTHMRNVPEKLEDGREANGTVKGQLTIKWIWSLNTASAPDCVTQGQSLSFLDKPICKMGIKPIMQTYFKD